MNDELQPHPLSIGIAEAMQSEESAAAYLRECADVKAWLKRINEAREFDKAARKQYAIDRKYARGDSGQFEVSIPIAGTYVDLLKAFLYARDPDLDVVPSDATDPPPMSALLEMAREELQQDPMAMQQAAQAGMAAAQQSMQGAEQGQAVAVATGDPAMVPPPVDPMQAGQQAAAQAMEDMAKAKAEAMMAPYKKRQQDAKQFSATLERIVSNAWRKARLKEQALSLVGSGLTVGIGWMKATWQERMGQDPIILGQIADLQDNLAKLAADQSELASGEAADPDAMAASIEQQIAGLEAQVEVMIARGLAIDAINAEDIQVALGVSLDRYRDASWIAHRTFMLVDEGKAAFPEIADKLGNASTYFQVKPADPTEKRDTGAIADVDAKDADSYRAGGNSLVTNVAGSLCVWEVWNRESNQVLTFVEGLDCYARKPYAPNPGSTRFYPFFQWSPVRCDGERHPQSLIQRTAPLLDDMNRIYSNRAEHRRRAIPKLGFDASAYGPEEISKLEAGGIGEMVGLKPLRPGDDISKAIVPIAYNNIDQALYDDGPTRAALEMAWGIQEALSSTIRTAKTATESEIQQQGTSARTDFMRASLDMMMGDLAEFSSEVLLQKLTRKDAVAIAGPWAFWPEGMGIDDLSTLVQVDIRAGSSGKPDTTAQQQAWAATVPILQSAIIQIGQLRGSDPNDIADCIEAVVAETLSRSGDRLEADRFLPGVPAVPKPAQPEPAAPIPA